MRLGSSLCNNNPIQFVLQRSSRLYLVSVKNNSILFFFLLDDTNIGRSPRGITCERALRIGITLSVTLVERELMRGFVVDEEEAGPTYRHLVKSTHGGDGHGT